MKFFALTLIVLSTVVTAQARPVVRYSEQKSCAYIQSVVQKYGEALVYSRSTSAPVDLYDIAYLDGCPDHATHASSAPFYVPTQDGPCFIGYRCRQNPGH